MSSQTGDLKELEKVVNKEKESAPQPEKPTETGKTPPKPEAEKKDSAPKPEPESSTTPEQPKPTTPPPASAENKVPARGAKGRGEYLTANFVVPHRNAKKKEAEDVEQLKKEAADKDKKGDSSAPDKGDTKEKTDPGTGASVQSTDQGGGAAGSAAPEEEEKTSTFDKVDSVMESLDPIMDVAGMAVAHAGDGVNLYQDSKDVMGEKASTGSDIAGAVTSGSSMLLNAYGTVRSGMSTHKARMNGDKIGYRSGIFETAGSTLATMGDMATFGTSIGGLAGGSSNSGNIGNVLSGSLGAIGSATSLVGSSYRTNQNKKNSDMLKTFSRTTNVDMGKIDKLKGEALESKNLEAYRIAQMRRNSAKAMKYATAMGGAASESKYKSAKWDTLGNVAGLIGGLSSIVGGAIGLAGASPIAKLVMTGIGALTNIIGSVAKSKNMISEKKRSSENKQRFVNEYIGEKTKKILAESNAGISDENEKVTEAEAQNIAIARLGINEDQPISDTSTLDQNRDQIFAKLCQKRARNIMGADNHTRKAILENMGLDPEKATEDAIISALGG